MQKEQKEEALYKTHTGTHTYNWFFLSHLLTLFLALFFTLFVIQFQCLRECWHPLGLGDVLRPLLTLCQLCYTLVGVRLSFPICFCSHYLAPGQAPCLKYTHAHTCTHAETHTHTQSFIFVLMTQFYSVWSPHTQHSRGVFFIFTFLFFLDRTGEIKRKCWPLESGGR